MKTINKQNLYAHRAHIPLGKQPQPKIDVISAMPRNKTWWYDKEILGVYLVLLGQGSFAEEMAFRLRLRSDWQENTHNGEGEREGKAAF